MIENKNKGFSFRKELSNMLDVSKKIEIPSEKLTNYKVNSIQDNTNYNKLYLKALVQPVNDLINAGKLNKYQFKQN